jgi:hypothetical protein
MPAMNYFDSNRTNTVILKFEVVKVMRCSAGSGYSINLLRYGILKMVKLFNPIIKFILNLVNKILFGILSQSFNHNFPFNLLIPNFTIFKINALNPYNSVTKYFCFHLFWKFIFGDPQYTHIHSIDVCWPWITKCTNLVFLHW